MSLRPSIKVQKDKKLQLLNQSASPSVLQSAPVQRDRTSTRCGFQMFSFVEQRGEKHLNAFLSLPVSPLSLVICLFSSGTRMFFPLVSLCCLTTSSWIQKHKLVSVWTLLVQTQFWSQEPTGSLEPVQVNGFR